MDADLGARSRLLLVDLVSRPRRIINCSGEALVCRAMARPPSFQPFLQHEPQRFPQGVDARHRCGVVEGAFPGAVRLAPVLKQRIEIEVPGGRLRAPPPHRRERPRAERHGAEPGRGPDALLRAGASRVDSPLIDFYRHATQRRHAVDRDERPVAVRDLGDLGHRLPGAGRGLGVDQRDQLGGLFLQLRLEALRSDHLPQRGLDDPDRRAGTRRHLGQALAEKADHADDALVPRLQQVEQDGLEPAAAGGRHRDGVVVRRAEYLPQHRHRLVHDLQKVRVEMADQRRGEGPADARVDVGGARAEKRPLGGEGRRVAGQFSVQYFSGHVQH